MNISRAYRDNNRLLILLIFAAGTVLTACAPVPPLPTIAVLPTFSFSSTPPPALPGSTGTPVPTASAVPQKASPTLIPSITLSPTLEIDIIQPTDLQLPSSNQADPRTRAPQTDTPLPPEADHVWGERTLGSSKLTVTFFGGAVGDCVRLTVGKPAISTIATGAPNQSTEVCATSPDDVIIGVQTIVHDGGKVYTVLAGRAFNDRVTAISSEFDNTDDTHADVTDRGFIAVLEGKHVVTTVIPIDQYGNLVGRRFLFR